MASIGTNGICLLYTFSLVCHRNVRVARFCTPKTFFTFIILFAADIYGFSFELCRKCNAMQCDMICAGESGLNNNILLKWRIGFSMGENCAFREMVGKGRGREGRREGGCKREREKRLWLFLCTHAPRYDRELFNLFTQFSRLQLTEESNFKAPHSDSDR